MFEEPLMFLCSGKEYGKPLMFCDGVKFRPGEVTLWAGHNGNGKSLVTGQVALQLGEQGARCAIMSFEMTPPRTILRLMRQRLDHKPCVEDVAPFLAYLEDKLIFLNYTGAIKPEIILGAAIVAQRDFGCSHVFIDNLMKVVHGEDDYNAQKDFVQKCTDIARETGLHIHIVHHARKGQSEEDNIDKFSVKGSGAIVDLVDNAILIHRNKKKERLARENGLSPAEDMDMPDSTLLVAKQRNGDYEGEIPLWFDKYTTAFCPDVSRKPLWGNNVLIQSND
jgi:twinkle protein